MSELKMCRICLDTNVRMHQISGSEIQGVYEKITNKKIPEDGQPHFACYICYCQLKKCQQLVIKSQKAEELLKLVLESCNEQNQISIALPDRVKYGLQNSLISVVNNIEYVQITEYHEIIKTENQDGGDTIEVMIKYEPDDDDECAPSNNESKLDDKQDTIEATYISVKRENISGTQTTTEVNDKSSQIVCDGISNRVLVEDNEKCFICNDCGKTCDTKALLIKHISGHEPVIIKPIRKYIKVQESVCDGKFTKRDLDIHTHENPFKCQYCNYTTKQKAHLERQSRQ